MKAAAELDEKKAAVKEAIGAAPALKAARTMVAISDIDPKPGNRTIAEDEDFLALVGSIRALGILQAIAVRRQPGGRYQLIDGERRWRAADKAGLKEVPCDVWPDASHPRDAEIGGVVMNELRKAHTPIQVARTLSSIKMNYGLTLEQIADRTGIPLDRVKTYLSLFQGSTRLFEFFEEHAIPLKVAAEFVRYEKATNEARSRDLVARYLKAPMSCHQIADLRKALGESK